VIYPHEWRGQKDELRWLTQEFSDAMADFIREAPDQYLWVHRRWKSEPRRPRSRAAARESSSGDVPDVASPTPSTLAGGAA
jgi:KDO2-lipid IV(A) lauroyltransferase